MPSIAAFVVLLTAFGVVLPVRGSFAQSREPFNETLLGSVAFRNLGPFRMGARIADVAVPDAPRKAHLNTMYVAPWTGGLFKTTNNGTTWTPVFDNVSARLTVGALAIAHANPDIVWVGTGDAFTSRSSYAGDGMYKSTDGGRTWAHMGLDDTQHIARIVIDPANPDIVYVAAMGHLYSTNEARGVYKTTDGGAHWSKVLYADDKIGVIDLVMNPNDPKVLYAATYDKQRLPWQLVSGGSGSGIFKTTDGGAHWTRLAQGVPNGRIGRIGLALYPKNPSIVYALIENANPRQPTAEDSTQARRLGQAPREREVGGEVYRSNDGGATWTKMSPDSVDVSSKGPYYFSQIRVDPNDDQRIFTTGVSLGNSTDGGRSWHDVDWPPRRLFSKIFGDVRTLWIDPEDSERMILGSDGGVFESYDGGKTADHFANLPIGEAYAVAADNEEPYNIYAGLQDHENWKGISNGPHGYVDTWDWTALGNGDGIFTVPDPTDSRWVYTTQEYGGQFRVDQKLGIRQSIRPVRESGRPAYRFIWDTPIVVSPHDSRVIYTGAQVLLKSVDRGDHWQEISPDLSTNPADKILASSEGGIPGGIPWFGISSISESPVAAGVLWAGTSDGNVQVTRDGGAHWTDATRTIVAAGGRRDAYVTRVRASWHAAGTCYVTKGGYKLDDFRPYIYKTTDFGETWTSIAGNLPNEPINVVWEDAETPDLLFAGTDAGLFATIDGGARWVRMTGIPNVPVRDVTVQPATRDLVVGSYGRGMFVANIAWLEELTAKVLAEDVHLFRVRPTVQWVTWSFGANDYLFGDRHLQTPNAPNAMQIEYYLKSATSDSVVVTIADAQGGVVASLRGGTSAGIHTVNWAMRARGRGGAERGRGGRGPGGGTPLDALVPPGAYTVTLHVNGRTLTQQARITGTHGWSIGPSPQALR
jgi:photosystem II stability/assembly factor-like uncharacterized protein